MKTSTSNARRETLFDRFLFWLVLAGLVGFILCMIPGALTEPAYEELPDPPYLCRAQIC